MPRRSGVPKEGTGVWWLTEPECGEEWRVGASVASLARLGDGGRVPIGFCLTSPPVEVTARGGLGPCTVELENAFAALAMACGKSEIAVTVRAAPIAHRRELPWPRMFVNVPGPEAAMTAVVELLSGWRHGSDARGVAVLVHPFTPARAWAVVCTNGPSGVDDVVVRAGYGIGDDLDSRPSGYDVFVLAAADLRERERAVADKRWMMVAQDGGLLGVEVPDGRRRRPAIGHEDVVQAARIGLEVQATERFPVRIELAWTASGVQLLWCERRGPTMPRLPVDRPPAA